MQTVYSSVKKTGHLVLVEGDWKPCSVSGEIIASLAEKDPGIFKAAPIRVMWPDMPAPTSAPLEEAFYPSVKDICDACFKVLGSAISVSKKKRKKSNLTDHFKDWRGTGFMLFNSFDYLIFFPIVATLHFLIPFHYRWLFLLLASCYFYIAFIPVYILVLFSLILVDYLMAIGIERSTGKKRKFFLFISILSTCLILFIFKYFNFFNVNFTALAQALHWNYSIKNLSLILPIGLSFHTFQSLSYVFEVYKGHQKAERHFGIYALYVMFFPQLVAGPIERPQHLLPQFYKDHQFDYERITEGLKLIGWGLFKKIVIADRLAVCVNTIYNNPTAYSGPP